MGNSADNLRLQLKLDDPECKIVTLQYEVVASWPHDACAYTEGLKFYNGFLYESVGGDDSTIHPSSLRRVELKTGKVLDNITLDRKHFAEGLTIFNKKIFQLTLNSHIGFIYNLSDLSKRPAKFKYSCWEEGWGLTNDGKNLILSDGTNKLYFLDPKSLAVVDEPLGVHLDGEPLAELNELEYIKGYIYANIRYYNSIFSINPKTGAVHQRIDLGRIRPPETASCITCYPNGIAYDEKTGHLFVTGKMWPTLFELRLLEDAA